MRIIYYDSKGNIHKYMEMTSCSKNAILPTIKQLQQNTNLKVCEIKSDEIDDTNWRFTKFKDKLSKRKDMFLTPDEVSLKKHMDNEVIKRNKLKDSIKLAKTTDDKIIAIEKYIEFTGDDIDF